MQFSSKTQNPGETAPLINKIKDAITPPSAFPREARADPGKDLSGAKIMPVLLLARTQAYCAAWTRACSRIPLADAELVELAVVTRWRRR